MKDITKKTFDEDFYVISEMLRKYSDAVYETQEGQPAHYDNQTKLIRMAICDVRCGLGVVKNALRCLCEVNHCLIED